MIINTKNGTFKCVPSRSFWNIYEWICIDLWTTFRLNASFVLCGECILKTGLCICTSKLVWHCLEALQYLGSQNKVTLVWVPGPKGYTGNEEADQLA